MTAIAGLVEDGKVWIGCDSAATNSIGHQIAMKSSKVHVNKEFAMGCAGSMRVLQLVEHSFSPPRRYEDEPIMEYMVNRFIPELKTKMKSSGTEGNHHGIDWVCANILIGYRGELFNIQSDYQVSQESQPFLCIGSGSELVRGSLHTSALYDIGPKERIELALEAAAEFNAGVRGPFHVVSV